MARAKVERIIVLRGQLRNETPFIIGKGKGDLVDIEILKDEQGNPFIPATSFVGALKHHLQHHFDHSEIQESWDYFWGSDELQSHFIVSDLYLLKKPVKEVIIVREGIAIDQKKGTVKEGMMHDYEVVNYKCTFELRGEIKIRSTEMADSTHLESILKTIIDELTLGKVQIGAMTTKGFGRFRLENYNLYTFDFPKDGQVYLSGLQSDFSTVDLRHQFPVLALDKINSLTRKSSNDFMITATFELASSLIIGAYSEKIEDPDKSHITFNNEPVMTGTSLKGTIRSRAIKIINTLGGSGEEMAKKIFGWVDTKKQNGNKWKSRFIVEESVMKNVAQRVQTRIKIDRFTGGVIEGALVETKPVWHQNEEIVLKMGLKNFKKWEAGLLLLILKDLWTSDLPIGGEKSIGRGRLRGKRAIIQYDGKKITLRDVDNRKITIDGGNVNDLEEFVKIFNDKVDRNKK